MLILQTRVGKDARKCSSDFKSYRSREEKGVGNWFILGCLHSIYYSITLFFVLLSDYIESISFIEMSLRTVFSHDSISMQVHYTV